MATPSKSQWSRLDMALGELCIDYHRTERDAGARAAPEAEWKAWLDKRIDRAKRNRLARHAVGTERNEGLYEASMSMDKAKLASYGSQANDYEWILNPEEDPAGEGGDDEAWGKFPPPEGRSNYQQWICERIARANRNREDGQQPTARRASDVSEDHHEMDFDIWMDSEIQKEGGYPLVRDNMEADDDNNPSQNSIEDRHAEWYKPSRELKKN
ncbi:uncharacterized protein RCC_08892 [Ramularia collo-cygni]|uniref:Uncharacterized protein n=1 Tax=Ramularia collo-cygni TaxID=112498 RepID=A0A2D3VDP1_9PEZI|nr:uncharacterized protein RCC_08892 [Ramularia collo-cygni]CZT23182.1 uncharacterized protein RCC_08892 [Ramularia collo-cygni]